jgi:hypothetical protein
MRLIRWFFTFILVFVAALLALALVGMLLIAFGALKLAGMIRWIAPQTGAAAQASGGGLVPADAGDLPDAPPDVPVHRLRSWDAARNRAVDRFYYKDAGGQWVFVRAPRPA